MRTTVVFDDEQLARAKQLTGVRETSAVVRRALDELIAREAQRRLLALKGTDVDFGRKPVSRRRPPDFLNPE